jgi:hypothetical protein
MNPIPMNPYPLGHDPTFPEYYDEEEYEDYDD